MLQKEHSRCPSHCSAIMRQISGVHDLVAWWHWEVLSCPAFSFISQPSPAASLTSTLMLSSVHLPSLPARYITQRQLGTKRLSPCLHLAILRSGHFPPAAELDEYRGCPNPALDKSQRKIRRVSASTVSLEFQISFVTLRACRGSHL